MQTALLLCGWLLAAGSEVPHYSAGLVFPLDDRHNHVPGIVEFSNGDLFVSWYRGSGERRADDVAVWGSRRPAGASAWGEPFVMADRRGFPDCNTCMMIDRRERLWLFWPTVLANTWESCLTNFRVSSDYLQLPQPRWERDEIILLKPDGMEQEARPLPGFGNIQPAVIRRDDGTLVAYMRENGPLRRIRYSESVDDGVTWSRVGTIELPNSGSGLDAVRLRNGHWVLVYNDTERGRSRLAISLSDDEGATWKWTRYLEDYQSGSYHYPAVIQGRDERIHVVYSYFVDEGKSMKHAELNEAWIRQADGKP
jgi:predicted neuraminidase